MGSLPKPGNETMKIFNPLRIIGIWVMAVIVINVIVLPILFYNTVGGEQNSLIFLMNSLKTGAYGLFILCLIIPFVKYGWFKKFWYINFTFVLISGTYLVQDLKSAHKRDFSFDEEAKTTEGNDIKMKTEYYSYTLKKIRSLSYWKNGKKDSIWLTFSEDGTIIGQQKFRNDTLIKTE
jgi:hypothetical protein